MDKVLTLNGARTYAKSEREKDDFYATPPLAVEELLLKENFASDILEPCCGQGHISKVLSAHGYNVKSCDLIDRGYGEVKDLYSFRNWHGDIVTNPPYKDAVNIVRHCLEIVGEGRKVAMFLKIQFLETKVRRALFDKHPPHWVYVSTSRYTCAKNGDFATAKGNAMCYAWYVWQKGFKGKPMIDWINPSKEGKRK